MPEAESVIRYQVDSERGERALGVEVHLVWELRLLCIVVTVTHDKSPSRNIGWASHQ